MSVHTDVIETSNGESAIFSRADKKYFLPAHEDETGLR